MRTPSASLTGVLAARWLNESGQSQDTIKAFWDVIFVSALGEQTDRVSMAAARKVMIDGFAGARGASDVLVPKMPLSQLFGARLVDHLRNRGVRILTGQSVRRVTVDRQVETSQSQHTAKAVICAVPWYFANTLFQDWSSTARRDLPELESFSHFPSSPITGIHLWFDQPITDENHSVMVGTLSQWVFREPWEQSNQTETVASESTGRNEFYFQVVISASAGLKRLEREDLISQILSELRHAFPNTRDAKLLRYKVVTDPKAVFSVQPEVESERPEQSTGVPWLQLAGDWTRTDWPATMEGAVISGRRAAAGVYSVFTGKNGKIGAMSFLRDGLPRGMLARCLIRN